MINVDKVEAIIKEMSKKYDEDETDGDALYELSQELCAAIDPNMRTFTLDDVFGEITI